MAKALPRYSKKALALINADRSPLPTAPAKRGKRSKEETTWPTIRQRVNASGTVSWEVDPGRRLGKRERFFFGSESEANTKADALRLRLKNEGKSSRQLTDRERNEAAECLENLRPYGVGLRAVTEFYIKHNKVVTGETVTLDRLFAEFKQHLVEKKRSPGYREAIETYVGPFVAAHPGSIEDSTAAIMDKWIKASTSSAHSRWHTSNYLKTLFNWCRDIKRALPKGRTEADMLDFPRPKTARIQVYTPEEMTLFLKFAENDGERGLLALGGFVGLRNSEITGEKTDHPPIQAEDILFVGDAVRTIQKVQDESVERYAPMSENAASWLLPFKGKTGPVIDCRKASKVIQAIIKRVNQAHVGDPDWKPIKAKRNGLRRSHITYRMAIIRNAEVVADECNTSPSRIRANYRRPELVETAKRWVAIRREL